MMTHSHKTLLSKPESIENRWDILYRDYPEVYEEFSSYPYRPTVYEQLKGIVDLKGKVVADVGAGTGKSTLGLAGLARKVIGIEFEPAMLKVARERAAGPTAEKMAFVSGDALHLPLANDSVDVAAAITLALYPPALYRDFIREGLRVAKDTVVYVGIPPEGYGGELYEIIEGVEKVDEEVDRIFLEEFHFAYRDIFSTQDYGTVENIVGTYGFIFGKKTIEHLKREQQTSMRWRFRVYWKE